MTQSTRFITRNFTRNLILGLCLQCASVPIINAAEDIHMASYPAISPDGSSMLFSWKGDIWTASSTGGQAQRLTTHPARDFSPRYTPDGKSICFGSNREGSYQVFIKPVTGGNARQITHHTEGSFLEDIAPDSQSVLVRGVRDFAGRKPYRFYRVAVDGKTPEKLIFDAYAENGKFSADGKSIMFTREGARAYRKGYKGSQSVQVWHWNSQKKGDFNQPVSSEYGCSEPLPHPSGDRFYYTQGGPNGFALRLHNSQTKSDQAVTHFKDDSVMQADIAQDGSAIIFRHLFDLYHLPLTPEGSAAEAPQKLKLWHDEDLHDKKRHDRIVKTTDDAAFSPSGLEVAFTAEGDIWTMDTILRKPKRVTDTPGHEKDIWFSPDGKSILYIYDDGVDTEVRKLEKSDPSQFWWEAEQCQHTTIIKSSERPTGIMPSPKGGKLAYTTYPGHLWVSQADGSSPVRIRESWDTPSVQWSPDGKWLVYAGQDDDFNPDIYIVKADGSEAPVNISNHPDLDMNPVWSPDGRRLAFVGRHHKEEFDIFYLNLYKSDEVDDAEGETRERARKAMKKDPAYVDAGRTNPKATVKKVIKKLVKPNSEKKPEESFYLKNVHQRIHRIPMKGMTPTKLIWAHDSKRLYFQPAKGKSIYSVETKAKGKTVKLADVTGNPIRVGSKGKLFWLVKNIPSTFDGKKSTSYSFSIYTNRDRTQWKRMVFLASWNTMRDHFYDPAMNNRDWQAIRKKYEDMAALAPNSVVLDRIINMMLGELNASHLGFRGALWPKPWAPQRHWKEETVHLGLRFDSTHTGKGWKVKSVIARGPADRSISAIHEGETITHIGGEEILPGTPLPSLLTLRLNEPLLLVVENDKGESRDVKIKPISYKAARELVKKEQINKTAEKVDQLSGGKLGYIHIARMMWEEFEEFEQHLYQQGVGKDGLVIDVRDNGGGFTTDHLLTALCQPQHAFTVPRNGGVGYPQDRIVYATWNKPIIVLCNQNSFSNAEIFAHAIRTLKRGQVVGVATAGGVISTGARKIFDAGMLRLPFRGWFLSADGKDMEMNGAQPHVTIWNKPGELSQGVDTQLKKAVGLLLGDTQKAPTLPPFRYRTELSK